MLFKMAVIFIIGYETGQMENHFPIQDIGKYHFFQNKLFSQNSLPQRYGNSGLWNIMEKSSFV